MGADRGLPEFRPGTGAILGGGAVAGRQGTGQGWPAAGAEAAAGGVSVREAADSAGCGVRRGGVAGVFRPRRAGVQRVPGQQCGAVVLHLL